MALTFILLLICGTYATLGALAISIGYHRGLAHRSFRGPKWLEYLLVCIALPTGHPIWWVAVHRAHHAFSDTERDPHSIHVQGFWYAQVGKYLHTKNPWICFGFSLLGPLRFLVMGVINPRMDHDLFYFAKDLQKDRFYQFLSRPLPFFLGNLIHLSVTFVPLYYYTGWIGVATLSLTILLIFNFGDAGDTIVHWTGKRFPNQGHRATNIFWYSLIAVGDGWHANHHTFPESARHGLHWWQIDGAWYVIRFLERVGLLTHVRQPSEEEISAFESGVALQKNAEDPMVSSANSF